MTDTWAAKVLADVPRFDFDPMPPIGTMDQEVCGEWVRFDDALAALARMGAWSGAGRVGGMYEHPGYRKPYPIQTVLRDLASQEGCDGEPYDAMVFAASYIDCIIAHIAALTAERDEAYKAVDENWITHRRVVAAEAEVAALRERVARLEGAGKLMGYVLQDDLCNRLTPRVIDIAYSAFMIGRSGKNKDDGGPCDWFNDTRPMVLEKVDAIRAALTDGGKDG